MSASQSEASVPGHNESVPEGFLAHLYPFNILVVDDSEISRRVTVQILRHLGYAPAEAVSGQQALDLIAREEKVFGLIFMDLRMPGMSGRETLEQILKTWKGPRPPYVIALTAAISEQERRECVEAGMADFLIKPSQEAALVKAIVRLDAPPQAAAPAGPEPAWEEAELMNPTALRALHGLPGAIRSSLLEELFDLLRRTTPPTYAEIVWSVAEEKWREVRHLLHQLIGNFNIVGGTRMARLCRTCSEAVKRAEAGDAGARGQVHGLLEQFESNFEALCREIERLREKEGATPPPAGS